MNVDLVNSLRIDGQNNLIYSIEIG